MNPVGNNVRISICVNAEFNAGERGFCVLAGLGATTYKKMYYVVKHESAVAESMLSSSYFAIARMNIAPIRIYHDAYRWAPE